MILYDIIMKDNKTDLLPIQELDVASYYPYEPAGWLHDFAIALNMDKLANEKAYGIGLNRNGEYTGVVQIGAGSPFSHVINVRILLNFLLLTNSTTFITIHNHPNNNPHPSDADIQVHNTYATLAQWLEMEDFYDYIITKDNYCTIENTKDRSYVSEWL